MWELLFWVSCLFIGFTYFGYPLWLWMLQRVRKFPVNAEYQESPPSVSIVLAARNEEKNIAEKLENLLTLNYPKGSLEIIVVDDRSSDDTCKIVSEIAKREREEERPRIRLMHNEGLPGKPDALNVAIKSCLGEIIVFCDVRQRFEKDAIKELVRNFTDPAVGCVSGELVFIEKSENADLQVEMGAYWNYEKSIRKMESACGSVVGATGAIYAARKSLVTTIPAETLLDDVLIPLRINLKGYRVVFSSRAIAYDTVSEKVGQEWKRKVRTLAGNWQLLSLEPAMLNPLKNRNVLRFFWHKIARLLVPYFLTILLLASVMSDGGLYQVLAVLQLIFYAVAVAGLYSERLAKSGLVRLCSFFCVLNCAAFYGGYVWLRGRSDRVWAS